MINSINSNRFLRGIFYGCKRFFGYPRRKFGFLVDGMRFTPPITFSNPQNIYIYSKTNIGPAHISATNAKFIIKRGCAIGPNLEVHTGNHARIIGKFVGEITEADKPVGYDHDIVVEEDVWIGCNVTLLSGVTIGRGSTIAAGAVVTKNIPPYCIAGGIPARIIKFYWTKEQILEHERALYPATERLSEDFLDNMFRSFIQD